MLTDAFPQVSLAHKPTALEFMPNLTKLLDGPQLWIKRDDTTGLAMGGNKTRQLEFYVGQAQALGCNALLTTGAVQSNHVRQTVAAARKMGWHVEVQLEHRVHGRQPEYNSSGNPFLNHLMGAKIHYYPEGEDEQGADQAMYDRAQALTLEGYKPFVIPLGAMNTTPWGALGYVEAIEETLQQTDARNINLNGIVVPTGSANTHAGVLAGLIGLKRSIPVYGFCVRREAQAQTQRVLTKTRKVLALMDREESEITEEQVYCDDWVLAPGYGQLNAAVQEAIDVVAYQEGILLDPTYTSKAMAGLLGMIRAGSFKKTDHVLFIHTGGTPTLFGYPELLL